MTEMGPSAEWQVWVAALWKAAIAQRALSMAHLGPEADGAALSRMTAEADIKLRTDRIRPPTKESSYCNRTRRWGRCNGLKMVQRYHLMSWHTFCD